jgi:hypothetical protein
MAEYSEAQRVEPDTILPEAEFQATSPVLERVDFETESHNSTRV